jgi:predicted MFS family arabinose efflux permease
LLHLPEIRSLRALSADGRLLFGTRMVRMFAYGFLSVVLALYLAQVGLTEPQIGALLSWTLVGDAIISLWITGLADRLGRRRMLIIGAGLMVFAGMVFALTSNILLLTFAAIIGTISPSGNEVGPFQPIEQAALPQTAPDSTPLESYRVIVVGYALLGIVLALLFSRLSPTAEVSPGAAGATPKSRFGLHRSRHVVFRLAGLFMLDAFGGGLIVQSLVAYWFYVRFGADPGTLGGIFFGANLFAGLSALAAARVAARIGLINTMVWTHIPSNILLMLVPLMPNLPLAIAVLLARFSISQMDVPTRQSYLMAVVDPDERSAAAGVTTIARTAASSLSPAVTGLLLSASLLSAPFFLAGGLKLVYDLALYRSFRALKPPEERALAQ